MIGVDAAMNSDPDSYIWVQLIVLLIGIGFSLFFTFFSFLMKQITPQRLGDDDHQSTRLKAMLPHRLAVVTVLRSLALLSELLIIGTIFSLTRLGIAYFSITSWAATFIWLLLGLITILILLLCGELVPQQLALRHPEQSAKRYSVVIFNLWRLLKPWAWFALLLVRGLMSLVGGSFKRQTKRELNRAEMIDMIEHGKKAGVIEADEFQMFEGIIDMQAKMAREVMVPRTDAFMLNIEDDDATNIKQILQHNFSRIPIYRGDKDKVIGIVHIKNLLQQAHRVGFDHVKIADVMQSPLFIPETIMIDRLLYEFKKTQTQLGVLLDEYGGLVGLVSIEDVLEEIVGEIDDESDQAEVLYRKLDAQHYVVKGNMPLDEFNQLFATHIDSPDVDTIAGYTLAELGTIPELGQQLTLTLANGMRLQTGAVEGSRLLEVLVILPKQPPKQAQMTE